MANDPTVAPAASQNGMSLVYLHDVEVDRVGILRGKRATALRQAGIHSIADLLFHVPRRYIDRSEKVLLGSVPVGDDVTVVGEVSSVLSRRSRRNMVIVEASIADETGLIKAIWFNQPFRARSLKEGLEVALSGKVERYQGRLQMNSPVVDVLGTGREGLETGRVVPIYRAVGEASSGYLRRAIHNTFKRARPVADPLPAHLIQKYQLPDRDWAMYHVHFPKTLADTRIARRRLVFDEFFRLEIALAMIKQQNEAFETGISHNPHPPLVERFLEGLPYPLTGAQERVIDEIQTDLARPYAMHRLLQGEVGSGKTVVAVAAVLTGVAGGFQTAVMAPTEVLAEQHFRGISQLVADAGMAPIGDKPDLFSATANDSAQDQIRVAILTGDAAETNFHDRDDLSRSDLLELIGAGKIDIVIGTHALISEGVRFASLGVAVVDEQHRFGVEQRLRLREKAGEQVPDLLIMTATPIPRTLAMTLYGDLDVSTLDEMPPGRSPITTWTSSATPSGLEQVQAAIRTEVEKGRQVFVVCPLVEDSSKSDSSSAETEYRRLRKVFPDLRLGLLHGRLRPADKDQVMEEFRSGGLDILVATTVIEVGIDVPNATVMVVRDADRFGLSQLHQLRGRVGRGAFASQCILVSDPTTEEGAARVQAMVDTNDGFVLAERDLEIRKPGTVFGARQSGFSDLKIANLLWDMKELSAARTEAFALVERDPKLDLHPQLRQEVRVLLGDDVEWLFAS